MLAGDEHLVVFFHNVLSELYEIKWPSRAFRALGYTVRPQDDRGDLILAGIRRVCPQVVCLSEVQRSLLDRICRELDMVLVAFTEDKQATHAEYRADMGGKMSRRSYDSLVSSFTTTGRIPGRAILCHRTLLGTVSDIHVADGHFVSCCVRGVHVCCTHNVPPAKDDPDIPALVAHLHKIHGPMVVTGDFNTTPGSRPMLDFCGACGLSDLHTRLRAVTRYTYAIENSKPGKRIDFILHRGFVSAEPCDVFEGFPDVGGHAAARQLVEMVGSDHYFVAGRFH
jgi:endonuclease/exonuclease/phosphatase family metal-dependent hydrolase